MENKPEYVFVLKSEYEELVKFKASHYKAVFDYYERKRQEKKEAGTYRPRGRPRKVVAQEV